MGVPWASDQRKFSAFWELFPLGQPVEAMVLFVMSDTRLPFGQLRMRLGPLG